ncbi:hypothetical protein [Salinibacterium xinjiangense]
MIDDAAALAMEVPLPEGITLHTVDHEVDVRAMCARCARDVRDAG